MRKCVQSLIATTKSLPCEIIVVDNGGSLEDSEWLLDKAAMKEIQFYIRNAENLYFGFARNQALNMACGEYVVISDNDILYEQGWLELCLSILNAFPEKKILVTPLRTDRLHRQEKFWNGELEFDGKKYPLNMRAGSNSFALRRKDFDEIGRFRNHRIAGSKWNDEFVRRGYLVATMEEKPMAYDMGFKKGYDLWQEVEIARVFTNGERMIINS